MSLKLRIPLIFSSPECCWPLLSEEDKPQSLAPRCRRASTPQGRLG